MNPRPLHFEDGKPSGVWFCSECRNVHPTQGKADVCCQPVLCECGAPVRKWHTCCQPCLDKRDLVREQRRVAGAEKLTEWDGPVYTAEDEYFTSVDDCLEALDEAPPTYVWPAKGEPFVKVRLDSVLSLLDDDAYEGFETSDLAGVDELQAALTAFEEANKNLLAYRPDYKKVLML